MWGLNLPKAISRGRGEMTSGAILVLDDDAHCRALVSGLLERVGYPTFEAASGEEALFALDDAPPALVLLDVKLPGLSGYEVCRELRARFGEELPIIFVSGTRIDRLDQIAGLLIGADDYIVKPFDPEDLLARARRALARSNPNGGTNGHWPLTRREREILTLLAEGLSQAEIAGKLVISPKTVGTHIQRILTKLGVHSRAQAVALAHRSKLHASRPL
jgi:DNA-binding NarL/FixJ family response regulator